MDDSIEKSIHKLIKKAEKIVALEEMENKKIETLLKAREEDGRLALKIYQLIEEINIIQGIINNAETLLTDNKDIFSYIKKYEGEKRKGF